MFLKSSLLMSAASVMLGATAAPIILSGTAQSCSGGKPAAIVGVQGINVSAFNKTKVPSLLTLLRNMDTATHFLTPPPWRSSSPITTRW